VEDDFRPGKRELRARLKPEARSLGLTTQDLARQIRYGFYGNEVLRIQRGRDEVKVWVRYPESERRTVADVDAIRITTPTGERVPLSSVADVTLDDGYTTITRKDGRRRIAVTADANLNQANPSEVLPSFSVNCSPLSQRSTQPSWSVSKAKRRTVPNLLAACLWAFRSPC
jgi:multidrug efflux pump subunit AcrB